MWSILQEKLGMLKVSSSAAFVYSGTTTRDKQEFLRRYFTLDETEMKRQSAEWCAAGDSPPKRQCDGVNFLGCPMYNLHCYFEKGK